MAQPRILMCRPDFFGIEYEINPWMSTAHPADRSRAIEQWEGLRSLLVSLGAIVELIEPQPGLPDLVFTANAGLIFGKRAIVSRFRPRQRRGEEPLFRAWFAAHGFETEDPPEGMSFEGAGDALFCGDTLFAGYRMRSDARGHQLLGARLGRRVLPLELVDSRYYHLDTCFCPLDRTTAAWYPPAFDRYAQAAIREHVPQLIEVCEEEAQAFACNAVAIGRHVVTNVASPRFHAALTAAGFTPHETPLGEFLKSGGSAKCLTLRLDGEEAAEQASPEASAA